MSPRVMVMWRVFSNSMVALPSMSMTNSVSDWSYQPETWPVLIMRSMLMAGLLLQFALSVKTVVSSSASGSSGRS